MRVEVNAKMPVSGDGVAQGNLYEWQGKGKGYHAYDPAAGDDGGDHDEGNGNGFHSLFFVI